jgi:hypothetical protein
LGSLTERRVRPFDSDCGLRHRGYEYECAAPDFAGRRPWLVVSVLGYESRSLIVRQENHFGDRSDLIAAQG